MSAALKRGLWWLHRLEDTVLAGLLLTMIGMAVAQIVLRDGFHAGKEWMDPLLRILVLWIALWGAVVGSREQRHVSIDLLGRFLPPLPRRLARVLTNLFVAAVCGALAWFCYTAVQVEQEAPTIAFATVPTWVCELIMPVGFSIISLRYAIHALLTLLGREEVTPGGAL